MRKLISNLKSTLLRFAAAISILGIGAMASLALVDSRPIPVAPEQPQPVLPQVEVTVLQPREHQFTVRSQGVIEPKTETSLSTEVAGQIIELSPKLEAGHLVRAGEKLLQIDPDNYRAALKSAVAGLEQNRSLLAQEQARAEQSRRDWDKFKRGAPSELVLRKPQLAEARAKVDAAEAAVARARRELERTTIRAPFDGMVRERSVGLGQFVEIGAVLLRLFTVHEAEVRLPLSDDDLGYLELPRADWSTGDPETPGPAVKLIAHYRGRRIQRQGRVVRTEGVIDTETRMVHVVVRVSDPYLLYQGVKGDVAPLRMGTFVEAEIEGAVRNAVFAVPERALIGDARVLVLDAANRLYYRPVTVAGRDADTVLIEHGLDASERLCLTPPDLIFDGMEVLPTVSLARREAL